MKNFTNNFKQFTSRLSARWLIMALMLLVGTSSAWGITIYYDNSQTPSYSKVYLHLGHDSYIKSYEMEFDAETSLYHKSWNQIEWNDAKYIAFTGQAISTNGLENKFTDKISTYYTINMGGLAAISDYLFSSSGANADPISIRIKNILNLNYIGFYIVENDNWNQSSFAAITSESAYGATDVYHSDGNDDDQGYVIGIVYAPSDKYNLTHSASWNNCPKMTSNAELGYAYYITGDRNYNSEEGTAPSCDFSIDNTIKAGETSIKSVTSSGKSKYGTQDYSEDSYYVKKSGETSLTKLEVVGNELQTQSLSVGEYTIYLLLFDGRIYAKGGEQTLTVETACDKPSAPDFGTNGVEVCEGTQVTLPTIADVTLKWYDENNQETTETFNATENKTYYAVVVGDCESDKTPYAITIKTKPTVTLNPTENTVCSGVALEGITRFVEIVSTEGSQISWYAAAQGGDALATSTPLMETSYFAEATLNGCSSDRAEFTITDVLSAPTEVPDVTAPKSICDGESAVLKLNNKGANYIYKVNKVKVDFTDNEYTVSPTLTTDYKVSVENKCGSLSTTKTITVNPKPSIGSITQNVALPVPFEDVVLTATDVTQGAEVKWYSGNDDTPVATGTTYIVTSKTAGDVIVKAKAFLGGCESDFKEYKVTFDEENCQGSLSNKIIINFTHPDKDETNKNCQYWGFGKLDYKINGTSQSIDLGKETTGTKTITIENIVASKITDVKFTAHYKFNSCNCEAYTTTIELEKGYEYDVTIEEGDGSGQQSSGSAEKTLVIERSVSLSTQPPLSAPAVKTVSATSVEGVVNFVGRVIKTGCAADANIWVGYQYKKKDDVWPTTGITAGTGEKQLVSLGSNKGKVDFSKTIEGLGEGDYHFRAYVINGYGRSSDANNYDQGVYYGIDIPVKVSTKKYPIENLQVQYANDKGDVLQDQNVTYCVGDDAYIKLIYGGSRLKPEDDVINISSTLENTFTLVEGEADLYTFVVKGNETITVNAKNKENTDNPTAELTINTYAVPVIPSIDIDNTTICSDDQKGAKITVSNPQLRITYQVYKILGESEPTTHGEPKEYSEGVLEFNSMKEAGTYYVRAYNEQCPNAIAQSLDEILTVIDAAATSISISPKSKTVNPWVPVTFTVTKQGNYDYTFSCKEDGNDVTSNMVINKSGDTYVVKFPKPDGVSAATDLNGQVTFANKTYKVKVKLNADVQCGTFDDESEVTLEPVNEICK